MQIEFYSNQRIDEEKPDGREYFGPYSYWQFTFLQTMFNELTYSQEQKSTNGYLINPM